MHSRFLFLVAAPEAAGETQHAATAFKLSDDPNRTVAVCFHSEWTFADSKRILIPPILFTDAIHRPL